MVVDGLPDASGVIQPRTREELERFTALVRSAVGFDERRGDRVTVDGMRFLAEEPAGTLADRDAAAGGVSLLWLIPPVLLLLGGGAWLLFRRRAVAPPIEVSLAPKEPLREPEEMTSLGADIEVRRSSIAAIHALIDEHPDGALAVLRSWIDEGTG